MATMESIPCTPRASSPGGGGEGRPRLSASSTSAPRRRGGCSLWTLNLVAAALHGVFVVAFCLLWALYKRSDGSRRDVTYHLFVSYVTFGSRPVPPLFALGTPAASALLEATRPALATFPEIFATSPGVGLVSPYPSCDLPLPSRVGTMPVAGKQGVPAMRVHTDPRGLLKERYPIFLWSMEREALFVSAISSFQYEYIQPLKNCCIRPYRFLTVKI